MIILGNRALSQASGESRWHAKKLNEAMVKVLTDPATVKRFADLTAEASPSTPQELAAMLDKEDRTVVPLLKKLGVKAE